MTPDAQILEEYHEVFRKYAEDGIIDLDKRLKRKFDFRIYKLEDLLHNMDGILPPTRLSQHYVTLITAGKGEKTVGPFKFPLCRGTLFMIPARTPHSSVYEPVPFGGYSISFNMDFFLQSVFPAKRLVEKKVFKQRHVPFVVLNEGQIAQVIDIYQMLLEEFDGDRVNRAEMLVVKTLELLIVCDRFCTNHSSPSPHPSTDLFDRFRELVQKYALQERRVSFYAGKLHVHANYLNAVVKRHLGQTAKDVITEQVLVEAKSMLHASKKTIKEIAYELGFDDPDQFSAFFKRRLHVSPARYKQRHLI